MSPEILQPEILNLPQDWLLSQNTIVHGVRMALAHVTQEQLPGAVALLLVRLAFAQFVRADAMDEREATEAMLTGDFGRA
jgi:hypothetical protein